MYRLGEHTADILLAAEGKSLASLFVSFAQGLIYLFKEEQPFRLLQQEEKVFSIAADDRVGQLVEFLNRLIVLMSTEHFLPEQYKLRFSAKAFQAKLSGSFFRGQLLREVKACTYHQAFIHKNKLWRGQVILDV